MNDEVAQLLADQGLYPGGPIERLVQDESDALLLLIYQQLSGISFGGPGEDTVNVTQNYNSSREVVRPERAVILGNERWETGDVSDTVFDGDLSPGDTQTLVEAVSEDSDTQLLIRAIGTTEHLADLDGDGADESIVRYRYRIKRSPTGGWTTVPGPTSTARIGTLAEPGELIPGAWFGPVYGFQVQVENITDDASLTDKTVAEVDLGGRLLARSIGAGSV